MWRSVGPMKYLAKNSNGKYQIKVHPIGQDIAWDEMADVDLVFLHRPCRQDDLTILKIARNLNIPVWVEYDDWLFDLPSWNPHKASYDNPGLQSVMASCVACADVISVTTSALYEKFRIINPNVVIVPNAYRSDLFPYRKKETPKRQRAFFWRGSNTHEGDIHSVLDGIKQLPAPTYYLGSLPWNIQAQLKQGQAFIVGHQDPFIYMRYIYNQAYQVMINPLIDCFFNRVKSNIAYIEAMHAGALCVAPDMPEWRRPGVITYIPHRSDDFLRACTQAIEMDEATFQDQVEDGFADMKSMYDITHINQIRLSMIEAMLDKEFKRNERDPWDQLTALWAISHLKGKPLAPVNEQTLQEKHLTVEST